MSTMTAADVIKTIKDKEVKFLDLRFTDTKGKMQHVTADASCVDDAMFSDGYAFDGSSIAGWKGIEASDMTLMLDPASAHMDPFFAQSTMAIFCDVIEPSTGELYERDPRGTAKKAEAYMKSTGVGDAIWPEANSIFDTSASDPGTGFQLDSSGCPRHMGTSTTGNLGHRPRTKRLACASDRQCRTCALKCCRMGEMEVVVGSTTTVASAQHELGISSAR